MSTINPVTAVENANVLAKPRRLLIGHGALLIFTGGVIGFGFLFFLIGKIELWPIPWTLDYQLPGTYDAWRMAHMEAIVNGALLWITAAALPLLPFSPTGQRRFGTCMIIVAWTIVIASCLDPLFADSRGLEIGGPLSNTIAFFLFYIGVPLAMIVMAVVAYKALWSYPKDD